MKSAALAADFLICKMQKERNKSVPFLSPENLDRRMVEILPKQGTKGSAFNDSTFFDDHFHILDSYSADVLQWIAVDN